MKTTNENPSSHAIQDDDFVKQLRVELEKLNLPVWVDSRNLRGGQQLAIDSLLF